MKLREKNPILLFEPRTYDLKQFSQNEILLINAYEKAGHVCWRFYENEFLDIIQSLRLVVSFQLSKQAHFGQFTAHIQTLETQSKHLKGRSVTLAGVK